MKIYDLDEWSHNCFTMREEEILDYMEDVMIIVDFYQRRSWVLLLSALFGTPAFRDTALGLIPAVTLTNPRMKSITRDQAELPKYMTYCLRKP